MIKRAGIFHPNLDPPQKSTGFLDLQKLLPGGRKGPASLGPTSMGRGFLLLLFFMFPGHLQTRADIPSDLQGTGLRWQERGIGAGLTPAGEAGGRWGLVPLLQRHSLGIGSHLE